MTEYYEVMFSVDAVSAEKAFCNDGRSVVLHGWEKDGSGKYFCYVETIVEAKAALKAKIEDTRSFLLEAEQKYA